jgi:carbonic anhydrase
MPDHPLNKDSQPSISPQSAIDELRAGNQRFLNHSTLERDWANDISKTTGGQHPFAIVIGCIDSRVPVETIFDQGIGDIFTARVAGNIVNEDLLGSLEFACKLAGAKAIVVLGHTSCGAIKGAIDGVRLGHLTTLLNKIEPIIDKVSAAMDRDDPGFADAVAEANIVNTVDVIRDNSEILVRMESSGDISIVGAMYNIATGEVCFY